jgi:hypothetical protein
MPSTCDQIDVERFSAYFTEKVEKVRNVTAAVQFTSFTAIVADDVIAAIGQLPIKMSAADLNPTSVLKSTSHLLAPYITELFNRSMAAEHLSGELKRAFLAPIVKKLVWT